MVTFDTSAAALSILSRDDSSFGATLNDQDINAVLDQFFLESEDDKMDENDEKQQEKTASAKKLQALHLIHRAEQKHAAFKQTMDQICEWLFTRFLPPNADDITAQSALQKMRRTFSNPKTDIPTFFTEKEESGFFAGFDEYFEGLIDNFMLIEADIYQIIYEIVYKMIAIVSVSERYPMIYFPLTWTQSLSNDFLRCFGLHLNRKSVSTDSAIFSPQALAGDNYDTDDSKNSDNLEIDNRRKRFLSQFRMEHYGNKTVQQLCKRTNVRCSGCRKPIIVSRAYSAIDRTYLIWRRMPFMKQHTDYHEFVFHDEHCVLLRKYKEAIRQYIFEDEWTQNRAYKSLPEVDDDKRLFYLYRDRNYILAVDSGNKKKDELLTASEEIIKQFENEKNMKHKHMFIRRKRRLAANQLIRDLYAEISGDERAENEFMQHELLRYVDVHIYGISLWKYCVNQLEIKNRKALWKIMNHLASQLSTLSILKELEEAKDSFKRFEVDSLNVLCQTVITNAQFPAATALYLAGFMAARAAEDESRADKFEAVRCLFVEIAKELLNKIESDHLLAIRLELPTNINYLTILDIGLKFELDDFLEFHRLQPIFNTMWREFEYLNPSRAFYTRDASFIDSWMQLIKHPNKFYYSPAGLFIIDFTFYIMYLFVFTYFIWLQTYPYDTLTFRECVLWIFSGGFIIYEIQEMWFRRGEYFAELANYWDIVISSTWIILFTMRIYAAYPLDHEWIIYFNTAAIEDQQVINTVATRSTQFFAVYTSLMAMQCVLLWTRLMSKLQRSNFLAPLIQMILDMISDVLKFGILLAIFLCAFVFALHYVIAGDLNHHKRSNEFEAMELNDESLEALDNPEYVPPLDSPSSIFLYTVQTLLGQQDWGLIASDQAVFGPVFFNESRAKIVDGLIIIFSVLGAILLLNLLIALMASTYERVRQDSYIRVNFYRCRNTYEMVQRTALMPPPLNILALSVTVVWIILETLLELCTCCKWTFSVEKLSPLRYSLRDKRKKWMLTNDDDADDESYTESESDEANGFNTPVSKVASAASDEESQSVMECVDARYVTYDDGAVKNMHFQSDHNEEQYLNVGIMDDTDIDTEKYLMFERLPAGSCKKFFCCEKDESIFSKNSNRYCRFCRSDMRNVSTGDIDKYFDLFRYYGQIVDDADIQLMRQLCSNSNYVHLCPYCFRPYILCKSAKYENESNRNSRFQIMLEIISFYIFLILVWIPLSIFMILPASWTWTKIKCKQISKPRVLNAGDVLADIELESKHEKHTKHQHITNVIQKTIATKR